MAAPVISVPLLFGSGFRFLAPVACTVAPSSTFSTPRLTAIPVLPVISAPLFTLTVALPLSATPASFEEVTLPVMLMTFFMSPAMFWPRLPETKTVPSLPVPAVFTSPARFTTAPYPAVVAVLPNIQTPNISASTMTSLAIVSTL